LSASLAAELFRYHAWANRRLIDFCAALDPAQLSIGSPTAYGTIRDTLTHLVRAERSFLHCIDGGWVDAPIEEGSPPSMPELGERVSRTGAALADAAARTAPDLVLTIERRGVPTQLPAAAVFATALYHSGEHRAQVVAMLWDAGIRPPDLSGWRFGGSRSGDYDE
jgi:uncharacterized damage-inducible protein DinB